MNLLDPISTIMTKKLITVRPDDTLKKVEELFTEFKIHHLPVVDKGELIGMVSKTDYLFFKRGFGVSGPEKTYDELRLKTHTVEDIMITGIAKLDSDDRINVAIEVFKLNMLHALPVMDGDALVGMVTTHDLIKRLADDKEITSEYK